MFYPFTDNRQIPQTIGTLPPTPESLITALDGRRWNLGSHRRYYLREFSLEEWVGLSHIYTVGDDPVPVLNGTRISREEAARIRCDLDLMRLYVDFRDLSVVLVQPAQLRSRFDYHQQFLSRLLSELSKAVPRPAPRNYVTLG